MRSSNLFFRRHCERALCVLFLSWAIFLTRPDGMSSLHAFLPEEPPEYYVFVPGIPGGKSRMDNWKRGAIHAIEPLNDKRFDKRLGVWTIERSGLQIRVVVPLSGALGYGLADDSRSVLFLTLPKTLEGRPDFMKATEWEEEPIPEQKRGEVYLRVANGPHKGFYLDFEEKGEDAFGLFYPLMESRATVRKAKLSEKPGSLSRLVISRVPVINKKDGP